MSESEPPSRIPLAIGVADTAAQRLFTERGERTLSPTEAALLAYVAARPHQIVEQAELLRDVWGYAPTAQTRTVYTTVNRLRSKIERDPSKPEHLLTIPQRGYEFRPLAAAPPAIPPSGAARRGRARSARPHLPAEVDRFVGRTGALDAIDRHVDAGARLVTLTGPGGVGKTRLARRFGARRRDDYPGGAWFCDLAAAREGHELLSILGASVDVPLGAEDTVDLAADLAAHLDAMGRTLLILDNVEQVLEPAARVVRTLLQIAGDAHLLVTSRERLRIEGEASVDVGPLAALDGVELLRLRAIAAGWTPRKGDDPILAEIAERLDHLPLALELAAARLPLLGARTLRDGLSRRLDLLSGRRRDVGDRHRTMRGAIEWSWGLLEPWERSALAQLSVCRGGFQLGAAGAVVDLSGFPPAPWALEVVEALWARSLLQSRQTRAGPRLQWLQVVRDFAAERLLGDPESAAAAADRHADHYAELGRDEALESVGPTWRVSVYGLEVENLAAAADQAASRGDHEAECRCCLAGMLGQNFRGNYAAVLRLAARLRSCDELSPQAACRGRLLEAQVLRLLGRDAEAGPVLQEALHLARQSDDRRAGARAARSLGVRAHAEGRWDEARRWYGEALADFGAVGYSGGEAAVTLDLANLERAQGRLDAAREATERVAEIGRTFDLPPVEAAAMAGLADLARADGRFEDALRLYEEGHRMEVALGRTRRAHVLLGNVGEMHLEAGRVGRASELLEAAVTALRDQGNHPAEGSFLGSWARLAAQEGDHDVADARFERATSLLEGSGAPTAERARLHGLRGLAELLRGDGEAARAQLARADALVGASGCEPDVERLLADLRSKIDG